MKLKYAHNTNNNVIDIDEAQKGIEYSCINCRGNLLAKKGKIRAHHFAHKVETNCSFESYLHKVAKFKFYEKYDDCLRLGIPFYLENNVKTTCTSCLDAQPYNTQCDLGIRAEMFDLTKVYDEIFIEKQYNGFVADILLFSNLYNRYLFIEFAVTHFCEDDKIASKIPIIEISLDDESDLFFIEDKCIRKIQEKITYYNIPQKEIKEKINKYSTCSEIFESFIVFKSGKAIISRNNLARTNDKHNLKNYNWFVLLGDINEKTNYYYKDKEDFVSMIKYALKAGINIKNCHACRFFTYNNRYTFDRLSNFFCKKLRAEIENTNIGSECDFFWKVDLSEIIP